MPAAPILIKPIPPQIINEGAAYGPFNLNDFIQSPDAESGEVRFIGELDDGRALPQGLICTSNGILSGIPAQRTAGLYEFVVIAENDSGVPFSTQFSFTIKERIQMSEASQYYTQLKAKVWEALGNNFPLPDIIDLFDRPPTAIEIYYLLQRFATLSIWDAYSFELPSEKKLLSIPELNEHFNIYDCGCYLIAAPKELFSHQRTVAHALQASKVLAQEVYKRAWTIELMGFDKMARACWVELQVIGDRHGKQLDILRYTPSENDLTLYEIETKVAQGVASRF